MFRDYEKSKRRRYSNQDEPKEPKQEPSTKDMGLKVKEALQEALRERSSLAEAEVKNLRMENKELQKNSEIQMKNMEELRSRNEELKEKCSLMGKITEEQKERITKLEKDKNSLEEEKKSELAEYKEEIEKERNEIDERLTELQVKYKEAQEHLKIVQLKENNAIPGDDEELNMLRSKCSELELELKSKNTQLDAQEIDLKSKEEKIVKLEVIKLERLKLSIEVGKAYNRCTILQKEKDELQKTVEETQKASAGTDNDRLELQKDCVKLQKLLDEKQHELVRLSGEREVLEKNAKQDILTQLATLKSVKAECSREKEEKKKISAKANLLEKNLGAKETEVNAMSAQKESLASEVEQLTKKVKEQESDFTILTSEKKKALAEADVLKRRLKEKDEMEAAKMELANEGQSLQANDHTMESSRINTDEKAALEELQAALAEKEKLIEALQKDLAANQDHLRKVI